MNISKKIRNHISQFFPLYYKALDPNNKYEYVYIYQETSTKYKIEVIKPLDNDIIYYEISVLKMMAELMCELDGDEITKEQYETVKRKVNNIIKLQKIK